MVATGYHENRFRRWNCGGQTAGVVDSSDEFLEALSDSDLLTADQWALASHHAEFFRNPYQLAEALVSRQLLTAWQVKKLLAGKRQFVVGKYKLLEMLGRGGMGTVYRAEHLGLRRQVALKVMASRYLNSSVGISRFLTEIRLLAGLDHSNIVKAFDADSEHNRYFLVMEYVPGQSLEYWLRKKGRFFLGWACECIRQAAIGLQHAADKNLIHRDVKPSNLMIPAMPTDPQILVKVLDFGLAFTLGEMEDLRVTAAGRTVGTIDYMAPEQTVSSRDIDVRSDIYSLGCVFYHVLTGRLPFEGRSPLERLNKRLQERIVPVSHHRPDLPQEIDGIVGKMLARERSNRFESPGQVAEALEPFSHVVDPHKPLGYPPRRRT